VVQAGRVESQRRIEKVLVAVVLVGALQIVNERRSKQWGYKEIKECVECHYK
jgi:hypothetical protein